MKLVIFYAFTGKNNEITKFEHATSCDEIGINFWIWLFRANIYINMNWMQLLSSIHSISLLLWWCYWLLHVCSKWPVWLSMIVLLSCIWWMRGLIYHWTLIIYSESWYIALQWQFCELPIHHMHSSRPILLFYNVQFAFMLLHQRSLI